MNDECRQRDAFPLKATISLTTNSSLAIYLGTVQLQIDLQKRGAFLCENIDKSGAQIKLAELEQFYFQFQF